MSIERRWRRMEDTVGVVGGCYGSLTASVVLMEVGVNAFIAELDDFVGFVATDMLHEEFEVCLK